MMCVCNHTMIRKSLTIQERHEVWIQENCVNLSKFVRKQIDQEIAMHTQSKKTEEDKPLNRASSELSTPERLEAI